MDDATSLDNTNPPAGHRGGGSAAARPSADPAEAPAELTDEASPGWVEKAARLPWWPVLRSYLAVWHRLEVQGREHLPAEPPFVLVSNHSSHLDTVALGACLPPHLRERTLPLAADDTFFHQHVVSALAAKIMNALPVRRDYCGRHAMGELRDRLASTRCIYILYPEGTRTRTGVMRRFLPGLGLLVADSSVPVVPCHIEGAFNAMPPGASIPRPFKVEMRIGRPLVFDHLPNTRRSWDSIAEQTEAAVRRLAPAPGRSRPKRRRPVTAWDRT